jgi:hypothetical protein
MPKRVGRHTIEHWRDGELIERIELTAAVIHHCDDGTAHVVFPPGCIELVTGDELRFDCEGLAELLRGI